MGKIRLCFLLLILVLDIVVKILYKTEIYKDIYYYNVLIKTVIICLLFSELKFSLRNISSFNLLILGLFLCFCFSQILMSHKLNIDNFIFNSHYFVSSIIAISVTLISEEGLSRIDLKKNIEYFVIFVFINSILIIVSYLFDIKFFETYPDSNRFGYIGLLLYHSEAGYLYFLGLISAYYFFLKNRNYKYFFILVIIFMASLYIGTKKNILANILFVIIALVQNRSKIPLRKGIKYGMLIIILIVIFWESIFLRYFQNWIKFVDIYNDHGIWSSLLSYRNDLLLDKMFPFIISEWSYLNYFIGGPFFKDVRTELEVVDVFVFYGIVGLFLYYLILKEVILKLNLNGRIIVFGTFTLSFFAGNLLQSINVLWILLFIVYYLKLEETIKV